MTIAHILVALGLATPSLVGAAPITDFSLFGGNNTTLGTNVTVNSGLVGSNNSMTLGGGTDFITAMGAGTLTGGTNLNNTLIATGDVTFNGNVTLGGGSHATGNIDSGGNVVVGTNAQVDGTIRAAGTVTIQGGATVSGNIHAGAAAGTAVTLGTNATVVGTITHKAGTSVSFGGGSTAGGNLTGVPAAPIAYVPTLLPTATLFSSGVTDHSLPGGSTLTLAPGSYDDISLGTNSTLNLSAGTYYFDTWLLGGGTHINFDVTAGDIQLFFTGLAQLGTNADVDVIGGDASDIYVETKGGFSASGGTEWFGTIYASGTGSGGDITFGTNSDVTGALWAARNLQVDGGGTVGHHAADYLTPAAPAGAVPEPATVVLLGLGMFGLVVVRRRLTA
jgi:cytoskeletal protein CcmA (bactofilin family)